MVHNGIEYGIMQMLAETYEIMRRGLSLSNFDMQEVYASWNQGELRSFLLEVTADVFREKDDRTSGDLIDVILDVARQKGTGKWTSEQALELQVPVPTIDAAVMMRNLSRWKAEREAIGQKCSGPQVMYQGDRTLALDQLRDAYHVATILTYAQGMALLYRASQAYGYDLNLEVVARLWRGGCIIRSGLLNPIAPAYAANRELSHLLLDETLGGIVRQKQAALRAIVRLATDLGLSIPAFSSSLVYYDGIREPRLPLNLVQAQRDYFGAHGYERVDATGTFHTSWGKR
jgi:6-phosphogluconate dehydrogenase